MTSRKASARRKSETNLRKQNVILFRMDGDVLDYFKSHGPDYKRRINAVLRSHVRQKRKKRA